MPRISVQQVGKIGIIHDLPGHLLPLNAWTDSNNVRFIDKKIARFTGFSSIFDPPSVEPHFAILVPTASNVFWVYTSLTQAFVYDGATHTDISNGSYSTNNGRNWNGGLLGGVLVLNNEANIPQYWPSINIATPLANLPNWPVADRTRILRPFKAFLVAFNYTLAGVTFPHRVRWSHSADPGTIPNSWDITDPTKDAGEIDLTDVNAGEIIDAMPLHDDMIIYKRDSTWRMTFIGGTSIFKFENILVTSGLLTARCVVPIKKGATHFLHNGYELVEFDGTTPRPITDDKWARFLRLSIDHNNFQNCFVFDHPDQNEAWFCYPENGQFFPNKALVWCYEEDTIYPRDFLGVYATRGIVPITTPYTWITTPFLWSTDTTRWSDIQGSRTVIVDPINTKIYQLETGSSFNGTNFGSFVERQGLALSGVDRYGAPVIDIGSRKMIKRVWPKITGGPIQMRFISQEDLQAALVYSSPQIFDPTTGQQYLDPDPPCNGRLLGWRFEEINGVDWGLEGFEFEMEVLGEH